MHTNDTNPGPKVKKCVSCSTQLSMKFVLPINFKMPTIFYNLGADQTVQSSVFSSLCLKI